MRLRYVVSGRGWRIARLPVERVRRSDGAALATDGNKVIVVGCAPERQKEERWRRRWPWRDFGSASC